MKTSPSSLIPEIQLSPAEQSKVIDATSNLVLRSESSNFRLEDTTLRKARRALLSHKSIQAVSHAAREALQQPGAVVLRRVPILLLPEPALDAATSLCSTIGTPFVMVGRRGLWQSLGVDLQKDPMRFGGVGHNPLHIDAVNTTHPPDIVVLLCVRPDPLGGGASLVSDHLEAAKRLSTQDQDVLSRPVFSEGEFYDMEGVGSELNPFPVLPPKKQSHPRVRFTAKMLPSMADSKEKDALSRLNELMTLQQRELMLDTGDMLLVNQHRLSHGRTALGVDQGRIQSGSRRQLMQTYIHANFDRDLLPHS